MQLYKLTGALASVWEKIEDEETDLDLLEGTLQCIEGEIEVKIEGMGKMIAMLEGDAESLEHEITRLKKRLESRDNRIAKIKSYLKQQMIFMGKQKVSTPTFTVSIRNNPPALRITDESLIPASYMTIIPESKELNKSAIKESLKQGKEVPGAELTQGNSLVIK